MSQRELDLNVRHDEPNLARLNLILAPNRTDLHEWSREIALDALGGVKIVCTSPRGSTVPHGVDNDILLGLVNAAVLQGLPEDDTVRLTSRELLKLSGITPSQRSYENLQKSLRRLQHTAYDVTDSWYDGSRQRWRSMSFSLIVKQGIEDNTQDVTNIGQWRAQTKLAIKLDDGLIRNIRAGHILPLDFELLSQLTQPMTRNVFRTLSFQRRNTDDQNPILAFTIPLTVWATHLGMQKMRLDAVLRALKPAHEELTKTGFLKEVTYQGRGKERTVTYVFGSSSVQTADPEAVALLTRYGISGGRTLGLAQTHGLPVIQRAVSVLEALLKTPYASRIRNKAGILSDILEHPDKYDSILIQEEAPRTVRPENTRSTGTQKKNDEPASIPRTVQAAHQLLIGQFDDSPLRRQFRDQVSALYVEERIGSLDLISLQGKTDDEVADLIGEWLRK